MNSMASARRRAALAVSVHVRDRQVLGSQMSNLLLRPFVITVGLIGPAMAQEHILISSDWGKVNAELIDNNAGRALAQMLPLTIDMRDHLRQEKTGNLPSPLPAVERQLDFSAGTLGLWNSDHLYIIPGLSDQNR